MTVRLGRGCEEVLEAVAELPVIERDVTIESAEPDPFGVREVSLRLRITGRDYLDALAKHFTAHAEGQDDPARLSPLDLRDGRVRLLAECRARQSILAVDPASVYACEGSLVFDLADGSALNLAVDGQSLVAAVEDVLLAGALERRVSVSRCGLTLGLRVVGTDEARAFAVNVGEVVESTGHHIIPPMTRTFMRRFEAELGRTHGLWPRRCPMELDGFIEDLLGRDGVVPRSQIERTAQAIGRHLTGGIDPRTVDVTAVAPQGYRVVVADAPKPQPPGRAGIAATLGDVHHLLAALRIAECGPDQTPAARTPGTLER
ncbi:hypothetical protein J2T57_001566 [Natronocella acetinitrilica]|uniref:Uncharacterized protein n=1 Tax=Natronocella acetinitrilica TaxID=414046 RepID=A0AAE3KB74_9GAMM|nr:hypothetical protein [Natronocella acetinitrilica]MCP1674464.1 hypothetical protein [Natronocella acetinitrilica]